MTLIQTYLAYCGRKKLF